MRLTLCRRLGKAGSAGFHRWKCGIQIGRPWCKATRARLLYSVTLGRRNSEVVSIINRENSDVKNQPTRCWFGGCDDLLVIASRRCKQESKVNKKVTGFNIGNFLDDLGNELQKEHSTEKGAKY